MKTKKPRLAHSPIEYLLLVMPEYDESQEKETVFVGIRTVKEFSNFQYELIVTDTLEKDTLILNIQGLRAPKTNVPTIGFARFTKVYEQPATIKHIIVHKMEKRENAFVVRFAKQRIQVKSRTGDPFIDIVSRREDW